MQQDQSVLVIARPGRMRDSLRALLKAMPRLRIVTQAGDGPVALKMITDHRPALVLLNFNLPGDEAWSVLKQIKSRWPEIPCIGLVDTIRQQPAGQGRWRR